MRSSNEMDEEKNVNILMLLPSSKINLSQNFLLHLILKFF